MGSSSRRQRQYQRCALARARGFGAKEINAAWRLWPLIRDRRATVGEVFRRLFADHEAVKFALASNIAYYSDDPETMPFVSYAIPQAPYLVGGGH